MRKQWSRAGVAWTHELVAYGLDLFHRRHLRTPTVEELRVGIDDLPSYNTIVRHYGTVGNMLRRHGYLARNRGAQPGHPPSSLPRDARGRLMPRGAVLAIGGSAMSGQQPGIQLKLAKDRRVESRPESESEEGTVVPWARHVRVRLRVTVQLPGHHRHGSWPWRRCKRTPGSSYCCYVLQLR